MTTNPIHRRVDLDLLRVFAMLCIVSAHLPAYAPLTFLSRSQMYTVFLGLSLFVFLSGYSLALRTPFLTSTHDMLTFLARRAGRIYPLYLPAVVLFIVLFCVFGMYHAVRLSPFWVNAASPLLGAQGLLSPRVKPLFTLWYVGVILLYYVVFALLARFTRRVGPTVTAALVLVAVLASVRVAFGLIDNRFFMYYPVFLAGILAGRAGALRSRPCHRTVLLLTGSAALTGAVLWTYRAEIYDTAGRLYLRSGLGIEAVRVLFCFSAVGAAASLARMACEWTGPRSAEILAAGSLATYAVYLYHRPILSAASGAVRRLGGLNDSLSGAVFSAIAVPLLFLLGYGIHKVESRIRRFLLGRSACVAAVPGTVAAVLPSDDSGSRTGCAE